MKYGKRLASKSMTTPSPTVCRHGGEAAAVVVGGELVQVHAFGAVRLGCLDFVPRRGIGGGGLVARGGLAAGDHDFGAFGEQRPAEVAVVHPHQRLVAEGFVGHLILDRDRTAGRTRW